MNNLQKMVNSLTEDEKMQIIADYEIFCEKGFIDYCLLREKAKELSDSYGVGFNSTFMIDIANECFRFFVREYFEFKQKEQNV